MSNEDDFDIDEVLDALKNLPRDCDGLYVPDIDFPFVVLCDKCGEPIDLADGIVTTGIDIPPEQLAEGCKTSWVYHPDCAKKEQEDCEKGLAVMEKAVAEGRYRKVVDEENDCIRYIPINNKWLGDEYLENLQHQGD